MITGPNMAESKARPFRVRVAPKPSGWRRGLRIVLFLALVGGIAGGGTAAGLYAYYLPTIPTFTSIDDYQPKLGTRVYSADNQLIAEFAAQRRVMVPFEKIPKDLLNAFIAAEDKRFRSHWGIDVIGVTQAIADKILNPSTKLRGASTITQQAAKSLLAMHESYEAATARTLVRKIREAILARRLERVLTKDEILYMYVHEIFLGHKAYGVQAAAEHYFRKNVWELNLAEMATLAGLPQRPSDYSPFLHPKSALARRRYVLRRMYEDGYISQQRAQKAMEREITVYPRRASYLQVAPHFAEQVRRILVDRYGERTVLEDGLQVYTTMHVDKQHFAQKALAKHLRALDKRQGFRGPLAQLETRALQERFISAYREHLGLSADAKPDLERAERYLALVTEVGREQARVNVAGLEGVLPLAAMRWAREPDPTQRVDLHYIEDVREALRPGDVVFVQPTSKRALRRDVHGWEIIETVPDTGRIFALEQEPVAQAALLSVAPESGYVVSMVGGYHFEESSFNRAMQACREPGSAFKPIVYSAALDKLNYTPSTLIEDKPLVFDDPENAVRWKPDNAGQEFRGELPLRTCLKDSINTPAIRVANQVGIDDIIKNARRLGIRTPLKRELGTAIGSSCTTLAQLLGVYVTFNQYGERRPYVFIRRVVDRFGNVLEDRSVPWDPTVSLASRLDRGYKHLVKPERRALAEPTAFVTVSLLRNVVQDGTAVRAKKLELPAAGKTGTTDDSYDAWFMGFTEDLVTGVWVGHDKKERPLGVGEYGGRAALPVWLAYMKPALMDYTGDEPRPKEQAEFPPPPDVIRVTIDKETGLLAEPDAAQAVEQYYREGNEPTEYTPDKSTLNPDEFTVFGAESEL